MSYDIDNFLPIRCVSGYVILLRNHPTMCFLVQHKDLYFEPAGDHLINVRCIMHFVVSRQIKGYVLNNVIDLDRF